MRYFIKCDSPCGHVLKVKSPDKKSAIEDLLPTIAEHYEEVHPDLNFSEMQLKDRLDLHLEEEIITKEDFPIIYS